MSPEPEQDAGPASERVPVRLDLQGGGWVLVLAGALVLAVVAWRLPYLLEATRRDATVVGDGEDPASYGFDLSALQPPQRENLAAAAPRDALPALVNPKLLSATEAEDFRLGHSRLLVRGDRVVGVELGGQACAYPLRILNWHELVLQELGGVPVAVTYSALCDAARAWDRRLDGATLDFGVSGLLYANDTLLYDRSSQPGGSSLWVQLDGRALAGPRAGQQLKPLPVVLTQWEDWKQAHPDTKVVAPDLARGKLYQRDPYSSYEGTDELHFPASPLPPPGLSPKARVLAVRAGGQTRVYPVQRLAAAADATGRLEHEQGGVQLHFRVSHDPARVQPDAATVTASGPLEAVPCFWFAWYALHPDESQLASLGGGS